jgi:hypothetical protein
VRVAGGPLVTWVTDHVPELAGRDATDVDPHTVLALPELAVPSELAELLRADGHAVASALRTTFDAGRFANSHRAVLVNLLARCRVDALAAAADALASVEPGAPSAPMAHSLADLARLRAGALDTVRRPS